MLKGGVWCDWRKEGEKVKLANGNEMEVKGVGRVNIKLHGDQVKVFDEVKYVLKFERNLISLGKLDYLGYGCSIHGRVMRVNRGALVIMKSEKIGIKNLYKLEWIPFD